MILYIQKKHQWRLTMNKVKKNLKKISYRSIEEKEIKLNYHLFRSKTKSNGRYIYSVCISSRSDSNEVNFVYDITRTRSRADEIFKLLHTGVVTPCTLNDILEDIL